MNGGHRLLTYCTNVHPGESVAEIRAALERFSVPLKAELFADRPLGLGLWLSRTAADELCASAEVLEGFRRFLDRHGLFVFTLNAFPYGGFHGSRVKEEVFRPSWADPRRLRYTIDCAGILAELLPEGMDGSISSVPLGHSLAGFTAEDRRRSVDQLGRAAEELFSIEARTGHRIVLGLEPEPAAELATIEDALAFLCDEFLVDERRRRHVGICLDACHEAVQFRDPSRALEQIGAAGVALAKIQVTAALEVVSSGEDPAWPARLRSFDEGRYFHQVVMRDQAGELTEFSDLEPFFQEAVDARGFRDQAVARVHFHVPVHAALDGALRTTGASLAPFLKSAVASGLTDQFEVETYTFDVIPEAERAAMDAGELQSQLARELRWTLAALRA